MSDGYVVVIGSASIDVTGRPQEPVTLGSGGCVPGIVRSTVGGVGRNIAENLARLEVSTLLLSVVGDDPPGRRVVNKSRSAGINTQFMHEITGGRTATFMGLYDDEGELHAGITDLEIMEHLDGLFIEDHADLLGAADMLVIDATLSDEALHSLFSIAGDYGVRVAADPASPMFADRLCAYLPNLFLVTPNASETASLCGLKNPARDRETGFDAARALVGLGVELAVVTLGDNGLAYADGRGGGYLKAIATEVVDTSGAGDAFTAAVIFGLLNGVPVDEAMRLGITAASLTIQSPHTVLPNLSQELLYRNLMV
jgi:pseudouridine kinase